MASVNEEPLLRRLHEVPRYDAGLQRVSNEFNIDWDGDGKPYLEGVLYQVGGWLALAIMMAIGYGVAYCVGCCCRRRRASKAVGCCAKPRRGYVVFSLLLTVAAAVALAWIGRFHNGAGQLINGLRGLDSLLQNASSTVGGPLLSSLAQVNDTAVAFSAAAAGAPSPLPESAAQLAAQVAAILATVRSLGSAVNETAQSIHSDVRWESHEARRAEGGHHQVDVAAAKWGLSIGAWVLIGLGAFWLLLTLATLSAKRCSACLYRGTAWLTWGAGVLLCLLAALLYGVALVGSDFCAAPAAAVSNTLATFNAAPIAGESVSYYAACASTPSLPASGVYGLTLQASNNATALADAVAALNATVGSSGGAYAPALLPLLSDLAGELSLVNSSVGVLLGTLSCAPVAGVWTDLSEGICTFAISGIARAFVALALAVALMLLLMGFGVALCFRHPGDPKAGEEDLPADWGTKPPPQVQARPNPYVAANGPVVGRAVQMAPYGAPQGQAPPVPGSAASYV